MIKLALALLFILTTLASYSFSIENPDSAKEVVDTLFSQFNFVVDLPHYLVFLVIFLNNSIKAFLAVLLGVLLIPPLFFVLTNGFILGIVVGVKGAEIGLVKTLMMILPHGIIEIPAMIISAAYGMEIGIAVLKKIRNEEVNLSRVFHEKIVKFWKYLLPAFFTAALIETYLTPVVANLF